MSSWGDKNSVVLNFLTFIVIYTNYLIIECWSFSNRNSMTLAVNKDFFQSQDASYNFQAIAELPKLTVLETEVIWCETIYGVDSWFTWEQWGWTLCVAG